MTSDEQFAKLRPEDLRAMKVYVAEHRTLTTPFDIIVEGSTVGLTSGQMQEKLAPWIEAGATWWMETLFGVSSDDLKVRVRQGPPTIHSH